MEDAPALPVDIIWNVELPVPEVSPGQGIPGIPTSAEKRTLTIRRETYVPRQNYPSLLVFRSTAASENVISPSWEEFTTYLAGFCTGFENRKARNSVGQTLNRPRDFALYVAYARSNTPDPAAKTLFPKRWLLEPVGFIVIDLQSYRPGRAYAPKLEFLCVNPLVRRRRIGKYLFAYYVNLTLRFNDNLQFAIIDVINREYARTFYLSLGCGYLSAEHEGIPYLPETGRDLSIPGIVPMIRIFDDEDFQQLA